MHGIEAGQSKVLGEEFAWRRAFAKIIAQFGEIT